MLKPRKHRRSAAGIGAGLLLLGLSAGAAPASAAERNYQANICQSGVAYTVANVGGWNQYNQFVHTPNFTIANAYGCGYQPRWWFQPNRNIEINAYNDIEGRWKRIHRYFGDPTCPVAGDPGMRHCDI